MRDYANLDPLEGTVSEISTLHFMRLSQNIVITNDHQSKDLLFKFRGYENFATLKGTESVSLNFNSMSITIDGANVPYRIWVFG